VGAIPKRKLGKGRKGRRRSHHALKARNLIPCPKCHELRLPHQVSSIVSATTRAIEVIEIKSE